MSRRCGEVRPPPTEWLPPTSTGADSQPWVRQTAPAVGRMKPPHSRANVDNRLPLAARSRVNTHNDSSCMIGTPVGGEPRQGSRLRRAAPLLHRRNAERLSASIRGRIRGRPGFVGIDAESMMRPARLRMIDSRFTSS